MSNCDTEDVEFKKDENLESNPRPSLVDGEGIKPKKVYVEGIDSEGERLERLREIQQKFPEVDISMHIREAMEEFEELTFLAFHQFAERWFPNVESELRRVGLTKSHRKIIWLLLTGLTQKSAAKRVGVTRQAVSYAKRTALERLRKNPPTNRLADESIYWERMIEVLSSKPRGESAPRVTPSLSKSKANSPRKRKKSFREDKSKKKSLPKVVKLKSLVKAGPESQAKAIVREKLSGWELEKRKKSQDDEDRDLMIRVTYGLDPRAQPGLSLRVKEFTQLWFEAMGDKIVPISS